MKDVVNLKCKRERMYCYSTTQRKVDSLDSILETRFSRREGRDGVSRDENRELRNGEFWNIHELESAIHLSKKNNNHLHTIISRL